VLDLISFEEFNPELSEAVPYSDIKEFLNSKEGLENVLFNTKIVFESQQELEDFINKLLKFGYEAMAMDYIEKLYHSEIKLDLSTLLKDENPSK